MKPSIKCVSLNIINMSEWGESLELFTCLAETIGRRIWPIVKRLVSKKLEHFRDVIPHQISVACLAVCVERETFDDDFDFLSSTHFECGRRLFLRQLIMRMRRVSDC